MRHFEPKDNLNQYLRTFDKAPYLCFDIDEETTACCRNKVLEVALTLGDRDALAGSFSKAGCLNVPGYCNGIGFTTNSGSRSDIRTEKLTKHNDMCLFDGDCGSCSKRYSLAASDLKDNLITGIPPVTGNNVDLNVEEPGTWRLSNVLGTERHGRAWL
ncbi:unnamed protein product [Zymoseptoria tritici ST99CH_1A5]|uniref:Uncharacterized protein n=4 Tax=Zymoseptoria tritici TaxID=1047171 RepID=F9X1Q7_ZYMTI|nr:uncharacterized protein MYCGRDRAFT_90306 [Zymoseptoria tritici IPO323]SMQ47047.1 unnamed protein product [Zymoseptoria tritici ST99CH_3D7]SMR43414.1 unnamed protein product [Zymoseptoria tritici ST99CH_1E4]SMR45574.1 unnamed protein product [Zymoseptoria tritici ST99CH_3D1]SMY20730.1 unnamed protein product [Zymoseptoria tritici ST99CH_1A5]EGP91815.1 hypothetical protein MYCGRDRAFT_90306 [Zymoseptoria tritici IPO323]